VADVARRRGIGVGGVLAEARTADGLVTGLDAVDVATGNRVALAEYDRPTGGPVTGRWHFHPAAFEAGLAWCRAVQPHQLFIVDELGPLELVQGLGWAPLLPRLRAHDGPVIAVVRPSLVDAFTAAMGGRTITRVDVTLETRDVACERALDTLGLSA
jgi:nucleoside-triphosphatase THEP1